MVNIKKISNRMYEVDDKIVTFTIKQGRTILRCSCYNATRFVNENPWCKHKEAVILFKHNKSSKKLINEILKIIDTQLKNRRKKELINKLIENGNIL